jgi:signal transduction histidine kinase
MATGDNPSTQSTQKAGQKMAGRFLLRFDAQQEADYIHDKRSGYIGFSVAIGLASAFLAAGLWAWDWSVDSRNAPDTLLLRLTMAGIIALYPLAYRLGIERRHLGWLVLVIIASTELHFAWIIDRLVGGAIYGLGGQMYFFLLPPLILVAYPLTTNVVGLLMAFSLPPIYALFGVPQGFDFVRYTALILPACVIMILVVLMLDQLQRRYYLSSRRLEQRVAARTAELQQLVRNLEGFSYSIAHDLRSPLRAINGYSVILKESLDGRMDDEESALFERIAKNCTRMGDLIDDILAYSRINRDTMHFAQTDLAALARSVAAELREHYPNTSVDIGPIGSVRGDPAMLRQLLANLVENAHKFSAKRDQPHVELGRQDQDGETVFFVCDNGVGFDIAYADKLFGMFQRMHADSDFAGTGVGLAIVKRIVERHAGRIWARAEPDRGACFYFTLGEPKPDQG